MNKAAAGLGLVVVLGGGYLGATGWAGQQAEARHRERLAQLQARVPIIKVSEQKYAKGFFRSTSTTTLQFGCAAAGGKPLPTATVTSSIRHGPIAGGTFAAAVVDSQLRIAGGDADAQRVIAAFGDGALMRVHTVMAFDGGSSSTFASPAARLPLGRGAEVEWKSLSGEFVASRDGRAVTYRMNSPGLAITDPAQSGSVRVGAIAMHGDGQAIGPTDPFLIGKVEGTLEAMEIAGGATGAPVKVVFSGMRFTSATTLAGELLGGTSSFAGAGMFGDVKVDKFDMTMSMKRIHAPSYQRLMETVTKEAYRCDGAEQAAALASLPGKIQADLMALLRHGPEVSLDRMAVVSGGLTGEFSYAVGVEGVTEADAAQPLPAVLLTRGYARAATRVPVAWLRSLSQAGASRLPGSVPDPAGVDAMLELGQAQGYLVRDGDYVKSEMSFAKGAMTVNGQPLGGR